MSINYTDPAADRPFTPAASSNLDAQRRADTVAPRSDDVTVPVYARRPAKRSDNKRVLLLAAPVAVAAIAFGAWVLTSGEGGQEPATETQLAAADASTTRLMTSETTGDVAAGVSETPVAPAATETPAVAAAGTAASPRAAVAPARAAAPAPTRRATPAAPARRASPSDSAAAPASAAPISARSYEPAEIAVPASSTSPSPVSSAPAPQTSAPLTVVPTRTLPSEPAAAASPATTDPMPGGAA